jgi:hypothetical protein
LLARYTAALDAHKVPRPPRPASTRRRSGQPRGRPRPAVAQQ